MRAPASLHVKGVGWSLSFIIFILAFINMYTTFYKVLKISFIIGPGEARVFFLRILGSSVTIPPAATTQRSSG